MNILKTLWRVFCCNHLWLAAFSAILFYGVLSGIDEIRPAKVWTWRDAIGGGAFFLVILHCAHSAGREWCKPRIRRLEEALTHSRAQYRHMLDMNKTMIDDVLAAQAAGVKVKTFLHGCGMKKPDDPQDDDHTAGA